MALYTHTHGDMPSGNKKRESNFELMRIIMMLLIIAHHYVVNSGITELYNFSNINGNMIFLQCIGFSGKIMINCFILITGYFSIKGKFSLDQNIFNVKGQYYTENLYIHAILTVIIIYIVCVCIELLRIKFVEKPFFKFLRSKNKFNKLCECVDNTVNV